MRYFAKGFLCCLLFATGASTTAAQWKFDVILRDSSQLRDSRLVYFSHDTVIFSNGYISTDSGHSVHRLPPTAHFDTTWRGPTELEIPSWSFWTNTHMYSTNQGATWDTISADYIIDARHGFSIVYDSFINGSNQLYWGSATLMRTRDGGKTWLRTRLDSTSSTLLDKQAGTLLFFADTLNGILYTFRDPTRKGFIDGRDYLFHTTDGGVTWKQIHKDKDNATYNAKRVAGKKWLFVNLRDISLSDEAVDTVHSVFLTGGSTQDPYFYPIAVLDDRNYFFGGGLSVFHSTDGGTSWKSIGQGPGIINGLIFQNSQLAMASFRPGQVVRITTTAEVANKATSIPTIDIDAGRNIVLTAHPEFHGEIKIVDVMGRTIHRSFERFSGHLIFALNDLSPGVYFCILDQLSCLRFIKPSW